MNSKHLEFIPTGLSHVGTGQYNRDTSPPAMGDGITAYSSQHRLSLPILQTRSPWPPECDTQYDSSPIESYTYVSSTGPRQDSLSSYASTESFRNYGGSATYSPPVSSPLCEANTYSFGTLQVPMSHHAGNGRLPSVSADAMSALNMTSLHSSLPTHTPLERRLPLPQRQLSVPYTIQYAQHPYTSQSLSDARPLEPATASFRPHINGVHSRNAMPWSLETSNSRHHADIAQGPGYSSTASNQSAPFPITTTPMSDPVLGYQFHPPGAYSPESSPATITSLGEAFQSSMPSSTLPPLQSPDLRYAGSCASLPTATSSFYETRPSSSLLSSSRLPELQAPAPITSLYSFSSEASDRSASDTTVTGRSSRDSESPRGPTPARGLSRRHQAHNTHSAPFDLQKHPSGRQRSSGERTSLRKVSDRH